MKRTVAVAIGLALLAATMSPALAGSMGSTQAASPSAYESSPCGRDEGVSCWDTYDDSESHPLRILGYLLNPLGFAAEWAIFRPFHCLVSQPGLDRVFGYEPDEHPGY